MNHCGLIPCFNFNSGSYLLSHDLPVAVSSALVGLTSVFGMGTGVSPPVSPPEIVYSTALIIQFKEPLNQYNLFDNGGKLVGD